MSKRHPLIFVFIFFAFIFMANKIPAQESAKIRYVAVGDSYTIGTGATLPEAWPTLLTKDLKAKGVNIDIVANTAQGGWTTQNALDLEIPVFRFLKPNFGTLLIGTNDWVHGVDADTFRQQLVKILDQMLAVLPQKNRLLIVTIPDFSFSPRGKEFSHGRNISEGIAQFNKIIVEEAEKRSLSIVDIYPLSQKMGDDPSFFSDDGLHPSAKGYAQWEKVILPAVESLLVK